MAHDRGQLLVGVEPLQERDGDEELPAPIMSIMMRRAARILSFSDQ